MIRKIKAMFIKTLKLEFAYRFEFAVWTVILSALFLLQYFIWSAIFHHTGATQIRGFSLEQTITYYALVIVFSALIYYNFWDFEWLVRSGELTVRLIKPISYLFRKFIDFLGEKILTIFIQVIPLAVLIWLLLNPRFSLFAILTGGLALFLAMVINFLFWWTVALSAVWLVKVRGIYMIIDAISWFASGGVIPLAFLPHSIQTIFSMLPFQYVIYTPIRIFLGQINATQVIAVQIVWIITLFMLAKIIWSRSIRALEVVGV